MEDLANPAVPINGWQKLPVVGIIEHHVLARTCIVNLLKRELSGFDIVEMASTTDLAWLSGRDVRLVAFNIGNSEITDPSIEDRLALLKGACPNACIALLSNRDDEAIASAAMQRGVRGFFPTSIAVEVAIAGLRLVLAGGVYRPLPIVRRDESPTAGSDSAESYEGHGVAAIAPEKAPVGLTPREQHVLAAMQLGLPNKLIAVRLNLSENTVKMHIQHIMRKCRAHNRTEAVLRCRERLSGATP